MEVKKYAYQIKGIGENIMRKINKNNQKGKITRGISAISLAAVATMSLAGCRADEPMVLYGMPDDTMSQEELDKAASETSESEAVDINEDKSNDENVIAETETDDAIVIDSEK